MVHFIGSHDSTRDAVSVKSSSMLATTKNRQNLPRAEGGLEDQPGPFEYRDLGSGQKQIGPTLYEPASSWSDEVAQMQELGSLSPRQIAANRSPLTHGENNGHSRSVHYNCLELVALFLSMSISLENVAAVQYEDKNASICYFRAADIDGSHCFTAGSRLLITERGHCLPLLPTHQLKHAAERHEAMNRPVTQENMESTNKRVSAPGPARSKKVDVSSVVQKTVEELLGTVVPNDAPLMGAGLDSIAAVDLVSTLSQRLDTELEPTALFDYPTIGSLTKYLDE